MSLLGPLTSLTTPASSCAEALTGTSWNGTIYNVGPASTRNCFPDNYQSAREAYYSPGIGCPTGYTSACVSTTELTEGGQVETVVTCCPPPLTCNAITDATVGTLGCHSVWNEPITISPLLIISGNTLKSKTTTVANFGTLNGYSVQIRFQSTDFSTSVRLGPYCSTSYGPLAPYDEANDTRDGMLSVSLAHALTLIQTATPGSIASSTVSETSTQAAATTTTTTTATLVSVNGSGLSTGATAGIAVGCAVGGLILIAVAGFFCLRRRKAAREGRKMGGAGVGIGGGEGGGGGGTPSRWPSSGQSRDPEPEGLPTSRQGLAASAAFTVSEIGLTEFAPGELESPDAQHELVKYGGTHVDETQLKYLPSDPIPGLFKPKELPAADRAAEMEAVVPVELPTNPAQEDYFARHYR